MRMRAAVGSTVLLAVVGKCGGLALFNLYTVLWRVRCAFAPSSRRVRLFLGFGLSEGYTTIAGPEAVVATENEAKVSSSEHLIF